MVTSRILKRTTPVCTKVMSINSFRKQNKPEMINHSQMNSSGTHQPERQLSLQLQRPLPPLLPDALPRRVLAGAAAPTAARGIDEGPSRRGRSYGRRRRRRLRHDASRERLHHGPLSLAPLCSGQTACWHRRATGRRPAGGARHRCKYAERRSHSGRHGENALARVAVPGRLLELTRKGEGR